MEQASARAGAARTRAAFGERLRGMAFKYPLAASNMPVPLPESVLGAMPPLLGGRLADADTAGMWSERLRTAVQQWFTAVQLSDAMIDDVFLLMGGHAKLLTRSAFETRCLELANEIV